MNEYKLNDTWVLWSHELNNNDWSIDSYNKIFEFNTINNFWKLYNNFDALGGLNKKNFFLMKKGITPIWEDVHNRNGGICSFKIPITKSFGLWNELSVFIIGQSLYNDKNIMTDINGISISSKNIWSIVKIWNKDSNNDISKNIPNFLKKKYNKCSIKYKKNQAEY
jgi:translation initiation factor 4E